MLTIIQKRITGRYGVLTLLFLFLSSNVFADKSLDLLIAKHKREWREAYDFIAPLESLDAKAAKTAAKTADLAAKIAYHQHRISRLEARPNSKKSDSAKKKLQASRSAVTEGESKLKKMVAQLNQEESRLQATLNKARKQASSKVKIESGSLLLPALTAAFEYSVAVRRRVPNMHSEVTNLYADRRCAGDLSGDRLLWKYLKAALSEDTVTAASMMASIEMQLSCASTRQIGAWEKQIVGQLSSAILKYTPKEPQKFKRQKKAFDSLMKQLVSGPIFLSSQMTLPFRKHPQAALRWFQKNRPLLRSAALTKGTSLYTIGLPVYDSIEKTSAFLTSKCLPTSSNTVLFRGKYQERFLKFSDGKGGETCNPLGAAIDSVGLPCDPSEWVPAGKNATVADSFTCAPRCENGHPVSSSTVVAKGLAAGQGLKGFQLAGGNPKMTENKGCEGPSHSISPGERPVASVGADLETALTDLNCSVALSTPSEQGDKCREEAEKAAAERQEHKGSVFSGAQRCQVSQEGDPEGETDEEDDPPPASTESTTDQNSGEEKANEQRETADNLGYRPNGYDGDGWEKWVGPHQEALYLNADTGETHVFDKNGDYLGTDIETATAEAERREQMIDSRINGSDHTDNSGLTFTINVRSEHYNSVKWGTYDRDNPDEVSFVIDIWGLFHPKKHQDCSSEDLNCGRCTSDDHTVSEDVAKCFYDQGKPSLDEPTPPGWEPVLGPRINVQPDATPAAYDRMFGRQDGCWGGGQTSASFACPGSSTTLCQENRPNCTCPQNTASAPAAGPNCNQVQCQDPMMGASNEGGQCGCASVAGVGSRER